MKVKNLYLISISQKGQITIPVEVRRLLGLEEQKKALLEVLEDNKVVFESPKYSLEQVFGAVKPIKKSFSQIRKITREERVKKGR